MTSAIRMFSPGRVAAMWSAMAMASSLGMVRDLGGAGSLVSASESTPSGLTEARK